MPQPFHLVSGQAVRLSDREGHGARRRVPGLLPLQGAVVQLREHVDTLWRADEQRPAAAVSEGGLNDLAPDLWPHLGHLVKDDPVEVQAAQGIGVVCTENAYHGAVGQRDGQFRLVNLPPRNHVSVVP